MRAGDIPFLEGGHVELGLSSPLSPVTSAYGSWTAASFGLIRGAFLAQVGRDFFGGGRSSGLAPGAASRPHFPDASASAQLPERPGGPHLPSTDRGRGVRGVPQCPHRICLPARLPLRPVHPARLHLPDLPPPRHHLPLRVRHHGQVCGTPGQLPHPYPQLAPALPAPWGGSTGSALSVPVLWAGEVV